MTGLLRGIILVFLVFANPGTGDKHGTLHCEPQNMQLSNVNQELQLTWESHPSCLCVKNLIYELVVLVEDKQVHHEEVAVMADHMGSSHWWSWRSFLPLECASHSVKIRSRCKNQTSLWTTETLPGQEPSDEIQVFPQDHVFEVGSRATFCCIIPVGEMFRQMSLGNYEAPFNTSMLNYHTYTLTVDLLWPTLVSDADVICKTYTDENGACAVIGYRPFDSNLTCETRDFLSVECFWRVGPQVFKRLTTNYKMFEQSCPTNGRCSQKVEVDRGERNWTLIASNVLGTIELNYEADLTKRVYMYPPQNVTISSLYARNASLRWFWTVQRYKLLNLTCQINVTNRETTIQIEKNGTGLTLVVLNDLIPNWTYTVMVRCATMSDFWKWSDWSQQTSFSTKGDADVLSIKLLTYNKTPTPYLIHPSHYWVHDMCFFGVKYQLNFPTVPDALDVWMHKEGNQTLIIWKLLEDHQSHGHIIDYEVMWTDSEAKEQINTRRIVHPNHSVALNLSSFKKYIVNVTVRNAHGSSVPSHIIIPSQSQATPKLNTTQISGTEGGFRLSWAASPSASCGYILDWCPMSGDCNLDWLKVPPSKTSATIYSKNLKDGVRYKLSIFICTVDAPVLLDVREGYVREQRIPDDLFKNLRWEEHASDVKILWDKINLKEQSAFIEGYVMHCTKESTGFKIRTDDPEASSLTVGNLSVGSYAFSVYALTAVGECGLTTLQVTLNSHSDSLVSAFLISLFTAFALLLVITVVCYRHWACIKQKVYPPIPEPVLSGKWLPSQRVAPYCPSEELIMAVPELRCICPSSKDDYIGQKDKCTTYTTTLAQNQTLKKHIPCEVILPPASSIICSKVNMFPNPVYNLVFLGNNAQTELETKFQDFEEEISNNYQPQDFIENNTDADSMSCVSTYIVLPCSP